MTLEQYEHLSGVVNTLKMEQERLRGLKDLNRYLEENGAGKDYAPAQMCGYPAMFELEHFEKFLGVEIFRCENVIKRLEKELEQA